MSEPGFDELRRATAYHEAGHAAVLVCVESITRQCITGICIEKQDDADGVLHWDTPSKEAFLEMQQSGDKRFNRALIMFNLAGGIAQRKATKERPTSLDVMGDEGAIQKCFAFLQCKDPDSERALLIAETELLLDRVWKNVERLAEHLLRSGTLTGEEVYAVLKLPRGSPLD